MITGLYFLLVYCPELWWVVICLSRVEEFIINMDRIGLFITFQKNTKHAFDVIDAILVSRVFITHFASFHVLWTIVFSPWIEISVYTCVWKSTENEYQIQHLHPWYIIALWNLSCLLSAWCSNSFDKTHLKMYRGLFGYEGQ